MLQLKSCGTPFMILLALAVEGVNTEPQQGSAPAKFGYDGYKSACCHTECCCTTCPQGCSNPPPAIQQQMVPMNGNMQPDAANGLMHSLTFQSSCICETNSAFSCKMRDPSPPSSYQGPVYPPVQPPAASPSSYSIQPAVPQPSYVQPVPAPYPVNPSGHISPINGSSYAVNAASYAQPAPPPHLTPQYPPSQYVQQPSRYVSKLKGQMLLSKDCTCETSRTSYCRPIEPCPSEIPNYTNAFPPANCLENDLGSILSTSWGLILFIMAILGLLALLVLIICLIWAVWSKSRDNNNKR